jgi:hypothetical protein
MRVKDNEVRYRVELKEIMRFVNRWYEIYWINRKDDVFRDEFVGDR